MNLHAPWSIVTRRDGSVAIADARGHGVAEVTAAGHAPALAAVPDLMAALERSIDALSYVNQAHPEATGWAVRADRMDEGRAALTRARAPWPPTP